MAGSLMKIIVGAQAYWAELRRDIAQARRRVSVQALSFEADDVGHMVAAELRRAGAPDRRVLVDGFMSAVLRDRFRYAPGALLDGRLARLRRGTGAMLRALDANGVAVRVTRPVGPLLTHLLARNHKKLVVIDERVAYTGGINLCEHNFAWHDLMLRIEEPRAVAFLAADFDATWEGRQRAQVGRFDGYDIHLLDGRRNAAGYRPILELLGGARREIVIHSPYMSFPFLDAVAASARRGAAVTMITAARNNWGAVNAYLATTARRAGLRLLHLPGMSHLKAALVDDTLVLGSCNFDFFSYNGHEEIILVVRDPTLIADFRARVLEPDLARALPARARGGALRAAAAATLVRALSAAHLAASRLLPPERTASVHAVWGGRASDRSDWHGSGSAAGA
jgi:cardiolipin synthase A/B